MTRQTFENLSPEERRLLYAFMPFDFDGDVMGGDQETLADLMQTIRRWWKEYEDALETRGRDGLEKEDDHLARRQERIAEREKALTAELKRLNRAKALILRARGMENGDSVTASELTETDRYAAHLLRQEDLRLRQLGKAQEEASTVRVQRLVITNLFHRREKFGDTKMPDLFERGLEELEGTAPTAEQIMDEFRRSGLNASGRWMKKEDLHEWALKAVGSSATNTVRRLEELGLWVKGRQGATGSGLNETIQNMKDYLSDD